MSRVRVLVVGTVLVLALGAGIGFATTRPKTAGGTVHSGHELPALTTVTFTPETLYVPPALPTTTTTTRPPKQPPVKVINKTNNKSVTVTKP